VRDVIVIVYYSVGGGDEGRMWEEGGGESGWSSKVDSPEKYSPKSQLTVLLYLSRFQNYGNRAFPEKRKVNDHK